MFDELMTCKLEETMNIELVRLTSEHKEQRYWIQL